ncbi:hypothetical protein QE432_005414 [Agrobacterium sp. SORGH_AS 745]|jgi:hypothetical protein|nr:hypothetical protein [Agrobacterium tumefaciens]MDQ1223786.1 hypothetical protein [Agrobacterium sp. SORGH_AS_0745]
MPLVQQKNLKDIVTICILSPLSTGQRQKGQNFFVVATQLILMQIL